MVPRPAEGVGQGCGLLRGWRVTVAARYAEMWLPGSDGVITPVSTMAAFRALRPQRSRPASGDRSCTT